MLASALCRYLIGLGLGGFSAGGGHSMGLRRLKVLRFPKTRFFTAKQCFFPKQAEMHSLSPTVVPEMQ